MRAADQPLPQRVSTGVPGLDNILGGGLPSDRVYLIQGDPGTGKTTLSLQFLLEGKRAGEKALFITLSETADELRTVAASHGWNLDGINVFELSAAQQNRPGEQNTLFHPSEVELNEVTQVLLNEIERIQPKRVVLDSLSEMRLLAQSPLRFRRQILALKQYFAGKRITVIMLDDRMRGDDEAQAHTVVHGVMELEQLAPEYGAERRRMKLVKLRGVKFRGGYHDYSIVQGGLVVYPRLVASEHKPGAKHEPIASGIKELDTLLGGGISRGTSTLIMGARGIGEDVDRALQYAVAAAARGEHAALFLFDENTETMLTRATGLGLDVRGAMERGQIKARQVDPAEMPPGEFVHVVRRAVEDDKARVVVIDSLNGYLNSMPEERFLTIHMHELLTYLAQQNVMTILILAQHGLMGKMDSPIDVSYLSDNVLLMRYFEAVGKIRQAISVMKKRTGAHERTIREFMMTSNGLRVGAPLKEFHGVLTGVPQYVGKDHPLLKEENGD